MAIIIPQTGFAPMCDGANIINWDEHKPFVPDQEWPETKIISGDSFIVELGNIQFEILRVDGGTLEIEATKEQKKCRKPRIPGTRDITPNILYR